MTPDLSGREAFTLRSDSCPADILTMCVHLVMDSLCRAMTRDVHVSAVAQLQVNMAKRLSTSSDLLDFLQHGGTQLAAETQTVEETIKKLTSVFHWC